MVKKFSLKQLLKWFIIILFFMTILHLAIENIRLTEHLENKEQEIAIKEAFEKHRKAFTVARAQELFSITSFYGETILIATNDIVSYNWKNHIITLKPGVKKRLDKKVEDGQKFLVTANGQIFYNGHFTSDVSSMTYYTTVIDPFPFPGTLAENQIQIELGYPSKRYFKGDDPRNAKGIQEALKIANKLNN